ncbi:hypothetical protein Nepgr_012153 [Nepenthes gracilis]|uniref:Uncharacterized protein n=1 Tax=Nepenthes gracilis TaxID=150966 RepID=A0AAD3SFJ5_NEPGR|nr:hypothetical protein Nepgr_012153 [Nepenthes gracilis]
MQQKEGREMGTAGKPKWFPPPLLTPRIFHLPWGIRWKQPTKDDAPKPLTTAAADPALRQSLKSKPVAFFDQGRRFSYSYPPEVLLKSGERRGRGRVAESDDEERENGGDNILEEKWRFEVDMLRAECKFLRMENEIAVKKSQRERAYFEGTLKSAVHTLISGKKKFREGKSVNAVFEEEIGELATKLVELQRSPRLRDADLQNCCNFDKLASLLQRKLEKLSSSSYERSILAIHSAKHGIARDFASNRKCSSFDVETLRGEMEGLSKGKLLRKMEEEYRSLLSTIANYSVAGSASTLRRYDLPDTPSSLLRQPLQANFVFLICCEWSF